MGIQQLHGGRYLQPLPGVPLRTGRVVQHEYIVAGRQIMQGHRLRFPLAAHGIGAAGTDEDAGPLYILLMHLRHIVRQVHRQHRITGIVSQKRIELLQV